jgi:hypothetical protein
MPKSEHKRRSKTNVTNPPVIEITHGMNFLPHRIPIGPTRIKKTAIIQGCS